MSRSPSRFAGADMNDLKNMVVQASHDLTPAMAAAVIGLMIALGSSDNLLIQLIGVLLFGILAGPEIYENIKQLRNEDANS